MTTSRELITARGTKVASRFVDGSDKRDRSKFNFEEKKDGIKFGVTERY